MSAEPAVTPSQGGGGTLWRRNLAALWIGQFAGIFGFSFVFPFLPLYLSRELGVHDHRSLALLSGLAAGATGLTMIFAGPVWGQVADRFGRKPMVVRAMLGGSLTVLLIGLVQNAAQLIGARALLGVTSGTMAAANALVAAETPPHRVGWALGVLSSGVALGRAFGPLGGGLLATVLPLRWAFIVGAIFLLIATIPVVLLVHESPRFRVQARERPRLHLSQPMLVLILCQALVQFAIGSAQQLIVLRVLVLHPAGAVLATALAFGAIGLSTGIGAVSYSRLIPWLGFRRLVVFGAVAMGATIVGSGLAPGVALLVVFTALMGVLYGGLSPALASMLGLEAPDFAKARVFGYSSSATALGIAVGPLAAGGVAAVAGLPAGLYVSALVVLVAAPLMVWKGREPLVSG